MSAGSCKRPRCMLRMHSVQSRRAVRKRRYVNYPGGVTCFARGGLSGPAPCGSYPRKDSVANEFTGLSARRKRKCQHHQNLESMCYASGTKWKAFGRLLKCKKSLFDSKESQDRCGSGDTGRSDDKASARRRNRVCNYCCRSVTVVALSGVRARCSILTRTPCHQAYPFLLSVLLQNGDRL